MTGALLVLLALKSQAPQGLDESARVARAAEKAADAAQLAAESAARAAEAAAKVAGLGAAPVPSVATAPVEPSPWTGSLGIGFISFTGNANSLTFNATAAADRKTEDWIFAVRARGAYGQARPVNRDEPTQTVALAAALQARGDRRFTSLFSGFLLAGVETDHIKSVEVRGFGEAGVGLIWLDTKEGELSKAFLRTDVGARYARENRYQYFPAAGDTVRALPGVTLIAPRFGASFRYGLTKDVTFLEEAEVLPNVSGDSRVLVNNLSKITARLIKSFSLGVSFTVSYDSAPAPARVPTDTALSVLVEYAI